MSDELREEIARALCAATFHPDDAALSWDLTAEFKETHKFRAQADAIMPILARVRDDARATERTSIVHYLLQSGACMADGDTFADEIERGWHLLK